MTTLNMEKINAGIADRSNVFYWQTDRAVDPAEAGKIWSDRHRYFTDDELVYRVNAELAYTKLASIEPFAAEAQTNLGNVNSSRVGKLESGAEVIIRSHPKGVRNGYFHVEKLAAELATKHGLPSYKTLAVHDFDGGDDFAFQVIEKLPGFAVKKWLEAHPDDEAAILTEAGSIMARLHQIKVDGFGPFDNEQAKSGKLVGLHDNLEQSVQAGLPFNLKVLQNEQILTADQAVEAKKLFEHNPLLDAKQGVLVHNDFADWNLLTDGNVITGILDWDECIASDPVSDIACWSTFFDPKRLDGFLDGYWQVAEKPDNFEEKFELLRLRYVLSKMTLRLRRYSWEPSEFMKEKIETGKTHLNESLQHFKI